LHILQNWDKILKKRDFVRQISAYICIVFDVKSNKNHISKFTLWNNPKPAEDIFSRLLFLDFGSSSDKKLFIPLSPQLKKAFCK